MQIPPFTLSDLASLLSGQIIGDPALKLTGFNGDPLKASPTELCFIFNAKFCRLLNEGALQAGAYLVPSDFEFKVDFNGIAVDRPKLVVRTLLTHFAPKRFAPPVGVHATAVIDPSAQIGEGVRVGAHVFIGPQCTIGARSEIQAGCSLGQGVRLGEACCLKYRVVIEDFCQLGDRVIVHPGAVIGADGFSYVTAEPTNVERLIAGGQSADLAIIKQAQLKVPSVGWVEIGDDVEIGANSCIDRGSFGATIIGRGTKIDNLVQVAHNCKLGEDVLLAGQCGLAGSVTLGDRVVIAGQAGCRDNTTIGDDSLVLGASHVHKDAPAFSVLGGSPAVPAQEYIKREKSLRRVLRDVPQLKERLEALEKKSPS